MKKTNEEVNPIVDQDQSKTKADPSSVQGHSKTDAELPDAESSESSQVAKLEAELSESTDKYLRLYSEFENFKKRVTRDRIEQSKMAAADVYLSILPVIDDLERAIKSIQDSKDMEAVKAGVQLIYSKLTTLTNAKGLKPMNAVGKPFDPELHDAITSVPVPEGAQAGTVIEEVEKGYLLHDRVIRHAKVIVAK